MTFEDAFRGYTAAMSDSVALLAEAVATDLEAAGIRATRTRHRAAVAREASAEVRGGQTSGVQANGGQS